MVPCTEKQANILAEYGYDPDKYTKQKASEVIDVIAKNGWKRTGQKGGGSSRGPSKGSATEKQIACLAGFGYDTDSMSKKEASELISRLADNNWEPIEDDETDPTRESYEDIPFQSK